ncbi:MAG: NADH-quinone oxidoreductase subunit A [Solirubrobacterales bacterium]|nr:NADH-quinone oxidoreductase subunit A [Solirubrobacterales bacterium]
MLRSYAPAIVFLALGGGIGVVFALLNARLGPRRRPRDVQADPYECGLPSEFKRSFRFSIGFYLVAMLFIIFDLEVVLLFPTSVVLRDFGMHGLLAVGLFIGLLGVAFVYEWRRGALDWTAE